MGPICEWRAEQETSSVPIHDDDGGKMKSKTDKGSSVPGRHRKPNRVIQRMGQKRSDEQSSDPRCSVRTSPPLVLYRLCPTSAIPKPTMDSRFFSWLESRDATGTAQLSRRARACNQRPRSQFPRVPLGSTRGTEATRATLAGARQSHQPSDGSML